jgi:hypothetical protein
MSGKDTLVHMSEKHPGVFNFGKVLADLSHETPHEPAPAEELYRLADGLADAMLVRMAEIQHNMVRYGRPLKDPSS